MGECDGVRGVWGYVRAAWARFPTPSPPPPKNAALKSKSTAPVSRIVVKDGRACGVALANGTAVHRGQSRLWLDAHVTFLHLMDPKSPSYRTSSKR